MPLQTIEKANRVALSPPMSSVGFWWFFKSFLLHCSSAAFFPLVSCQLIVFIAIELSYGYGDCYCGKWLCVAFTLWHCGPKVVRQQSKLAIPLMLSAPQTIISTMGVILIYTLAAANAQVSKQQRRTRPCPIDLLSVCTARVLDKSLTKHFRRGIGSNISALDGCGGPLSCKRI